MNIQTATEELIKATKEVDESKEQVVVLAELFELLREGEKKKWTFSSQEEKEKTQEKIKDKISDCFFRYKKDKNRIKTLDNLGEALEAVFQGSAVNKKPN